MGEEGGREREQTEKGEKRRDWLSLTAFFRELLQKWSVLLAIGVPIDEYEDIRVAL